MQTQLEKIIGSVRIQGDPGSPDLDGALTQYFAMSGQLDAQAVRQSVDLALERIAVAMLEVAHGRR